MTIPSDIDVVAIGEGQLRLSSPVGTALADATDLHADVAGTEGNVLGLLSQLGISAALITSLPRSPLGQRVAAEYRGAGIDLRACVWRDSGRLALYFVENSSPPVPSRVFYDRQHTCFTDLAIDEIDWTLVESARLLHLSGITAALGDASYALLRHAMDRHAGLRSVDVNYRSLLWSARDARQRLEPLLDGADVIFCSRRDAAAVFGIHGETAAAAGELASRFGARVVAVSDGADPVVVSVEGRSLTARPPRTTVVDRVGAGDAFVGGLLYGVLHDDVETGLDLGIAAAALTLTRHGDLLHTTLDELNWVARSSRSGTDIVR